MNSDIGFYTVIHEMNYFYKRIALLNMSSGGYLEKTEETIIVSPGTP